MKYQLLYIDKNHRFYEQAVEIRIACFFRGMRNSTDLINDAFEEKGSHLIYLNDQDQVLGTGRLNIKNTKAIISQMAIDFPSQKKGIGTLILLELLQKCKEKEVTVIELSARKTAIAFYEKYGFKVDGKEYASKKTGVIHQKMLRISFK